MGISTWIESWLSAAHWGGESSSLLARIILSAAVLLMACIAFYISRRIVRSGVHRLIRQTRATWDDRFEENRFFLRMTWLVPALVIDLFLPAVFSGYAQGVAVAGGALNLYLLLVGVLVVDAGINSLHDIYQASRVSRDIPLKGLSQVLKILLYCAAGIMAVSVVLDRSPLYLLSGLGALTAVLMLIFKDPILGFVAGIQLISNRMLKNGDWIEMPKYGADGDVVDITLTTVKVRNWDKTITTIPTYALIADSFKNWRGMQESSGRRIKRAIFIDMNSIAFCTPRMLERFAKIRHIAAYVQRKKDEITQFNTALGDQAQDAVNIRRLTNIGTFRAYAAAYLQHHPMINPEMTLMVRQLAPTDHGLPLEVYAFCKDKAWVNYEAVQADIFDHLLAICREFDLRVFQYPAGADLRQLASFSGMVRQPQTDR